MLALSIRPALAGIADSPLPVLEAGKITLHLYSVPGVIDANGLGTFFSCTSTATSPITVGVELFSVFGAVFNNAATSSLSLIPGETRIFATSTAVGISVDSSLGGVGKGSARILATSKNLVCTAFVADNTALPAGSGWQLTIIAKTKQKAAN